MGLLPAIMAGGYVAGIGPSPDASGAFAKEDSDHMYITPGSSGDLKEWTFSAWVKITNTGDYKEIYGVDGNDGIRWQNDDTFAIVVNAAFYFNTTEVFRDVAEWYHIVVNYNSDHATAADRCRVWVNNKLLVNNTGALTSGLSADIGSSGLIHTLGSGYNGVDALHHDGYLAEVYFVNAQSLDPDSFAEEGGTTGQWIPKAYAGTYGTNGFYIDFKDGADLGKDVSGNGNDFTNSGATQSNDIPTDNHCIMNALSLDPDFTIGGTGLEILSTNTGIGSIHSTFFPNSGKWYWEVEVVVAGPALMVGVVVHDHKPTDHMAVVGAYSYYGYNGDRYISSVVSSYGASFTTGDIIGVALDIDTGTLEFFKNNSSQGVATAALAGLSLSPALSDAASNSTTDTIMRFAEGSWSYTPPSGYQALSTSNFPTPDVVKSTDYFEGIVYDDGAGAKTLNHQSDLVWLKSRGSAFSHKLVDSVRGATKAVSADTNVAEVTESTGLTSFDTGGFTVGADTDYSDVTGVGMVAWSWKEGVIPGLDIVTYTGDGLAGHTISHSLGVAPEFMMVKSLTDTISWGIYHEQNTTEPETELLRLDLVNGTLDNATMWDDTAPSSTVFTVGIGTIGNKSGIDFIGYMFAPIDGFSRFSNYIGNGSTDGPFVYCGFQPAFLLIKRVDTTGGWFIFDPKRSTANLVDKAVAAEVSTSEVSGSDYNLDLLSNGFKIRTTFVELNGTGGDYIYMAFAEFPFQYSRAR